MSDHSIISIDIDFSRFRKGKGFFKFNNSLVKDPEYIKLIHDTIKKTTAFYAEDIYDATFLENATPEQLQTLILTVNPQLFLETLLLEIRGKTIWYCSWSKKKKQEALKLASHRLEVAEMISDQAPTNEEFRNQLDHARAEVAQLIEEETEAAMSRARVRWQIEGEKPSKYFCSLEKYNAAQKYIPKLTIKKQGEPNKTISGQSAIEYEIFSFYQKLYRTQESKIKSTSIEEFLGKEGKDRNTLSPPQTNELEGLLTIQEITKYIKKCRADASPGSSGFSGGFFKMFWRDLKYFILNSLNYAYESGSLSVSQKLGVIILLPKPEKDKQILANWRPISLLNTTYKILSGALAERLKVVLPDIVHEDQKGFVSGRYIGECIRNTYDILDYAKSQNRTGLLLAIDFEKAFDSIAHSFIIKTLKYFGFGLSFIRWVNILLNGAESCVNHCGNISPRFEVGRSCRQGDPISPYLFILCVEILAIRIRENDKVRGFRVGNLVKKLDFYADDLTAYLDGTEQSLKTIIDILNEFELVSGLKINLTKCKAVWFGKRRFDKTKLCSELKIVWCNKFRLLGIDFDADLSEMDTNFETKMEEIKKLYKNWLYRSLTPIGRITVIKTLALPKLSHIVLVCPHINEETLKELEKSSFQFLWKNKPERTKRIYVTLPYSKGGLNMPDIRKFWDSLKMAWLRRMQVSGDVWWKLLQLDLVKNKCGLTDIWYGGPNRFRDMSKQLSNKFWAEIFRIAGTLMNEIPYAYPFYFFHLNLFDNSLFATNEISLSKNEFGTLWGKGIAQIGDFFETNTMPPKLLTLQELNLKYRLNLDFLSYHRIKLAIELGSKRLNYKILGSDLSDIVTPRQPILFKISNLRKKGCKIFYEILRAKDFLMNSTEAAELKWQKEINLTFSVKFWDECWKMIKNPIIDNKTRWIQFQINRFILPTNFSVNKYNINQDPNCSFCPPNTHLEELSYLLWDCPKVRQFWFSIEIFLNLFFPSYKLNKKKAIFGDTESDKVINMILMWGKRYIWRQKFTTRRLDMATFHDFLKYKVNELMRIMQFKIKLDEFLERWGKIVNFYALPIHSPLFFNDIMS